MAVPSLSEMYGSGPDYLGNLAIFGGQVANGRIISNEDGPLNYGYWQGIDWQNGQIDPAQRRLASDNLIRLVADRLKIHRYYDLLEVGSGTGYGTRLILDAYQPSTISGVDQSPDQVARAIRTLERRGCGDRLSFRQGVAENLRFNNNQFHGVYSVEVAQHFSSFSNFAKEAHRVLRQGGRLALCAFWMSQPEATPELKKLLPTIDSGADNPMFIGEAAKDLLDAGFSRINVRAIGNQVWRPLVTYCEQVAPDQEWSRNWVLAYEQGLIDYYLVSGQKISSGST